MNFKLQLALTHLAAACGAFALAWFGPSIAGWGLGAGLMGLAIVAAAGAFAAWRQLKSALTQLQAALDKDGHGPLPPHLTEFAELAVRLDQDAQRHRERAFEAEHLIRRLVQEIDPADVERGDGRRLLTRLLGQLARHATRDAGRAAGFVDDISRLAHEASENAAQQSNAVASTVTFAEQLSDNITAVAQNAEAAKDAANEVRVSSIRGQELVQELIRGMERIRLSVEAGEKKVLALGERSRGIGSIVETMSAISARAQMLTINDSIEAVRAGEDGRGFSVVAEEVRRLSEHTATAAREIANLVELIQVESTDTIAAMAEERSQVQQEVHRVREAGAALERINATSSDSAERVSQISRAANDQLQGTQEVVMAMQRVLELADGIAAATDQIRRTAADVKAASRDVEDRVSPLFHFEDDVAEAKPGTGRAYERLARWSGSQRPAPGEELVAAVAGGEFKR